MKLNEELLGKVLVHCQMNNLKHQRVGSSTIPSVENPMDFDLVVKVDDLESSLCLFKQFGSHSEGSLVPESSFASVKFFEFDGRISINVILCDDEELYGQYAEANAIAVEHDLVEKQERIAVFDFVMDRETKLTPEQFALLPMGKRREFSRAVENLYEEDLPF